MFILQTLKNNIQCVDDISSKVFQFVWESVQETLARKWDARFNFDTDDWEKISINNFIKWMLQRSFPYLLYRSSKKFSRDNDINYQLRSCFLPYKLYKL